MTIDEHIAHKVAAAPPLSAQRVARLRQLLASSPADATTVTPRRAARPRAEKAA